MRHALKINNTNQSPEPEPRQPVDTPQLGMVLSIDHPRRFLSLHHCLDALHQHVMAENESRGSTRHAATRAWRFGSHKHTTAHILNGFLGPYAASKADGEAPAEIMDQGTTERGVIVG